MNNFQSYTVLLKWLFLFFIVHASSIFAQDTLKLAPADSLIQQNKTLIPTDSIEIINTSNPSGKKKLNLFKKFNTTGEQKPIKAALWSLAPGGGQAFNKQLWKTPIFATSVTGLTIYAIKSHRNYKTQRSHYINLLNNGGLINLADSVATLRVLKDKHLKRYNAALNSALIFYSFNLIDAYVHRQKMNIEERRRRPLQAGYYSLVLPGLGQIYNKRWWKVPIIYGGMGALSFFIYNNAKDVQRYQNEYLARTRLHYGEIDPTLSGFNDSNLIDLKASAEQRKQLSIIGLSLLYALNVIDATIDAHLLDFDNVINEEISLQFTPYFTPVSAEGKSERGFAIQIQF